MQKRNAYNLFTRREMLLDSGKTLWTDDMLDTACIGGCSFRINTQTDQPGGQKFMSLINHICNLLSGFGKINISFWSDSDMVLFTKVLHSNTDA